MNETWDAVADTLWNYVNMDAPYDWRIKQSAQQKLKSIVADNEFEYIFNDADPGKINRRIREVLSKYLLNVDVKVSQQVATWIVSDWGGIKKGKDKVSAWIEELEGFSPDTIHEFVNRHRNKRVSSWSKILAFADGSKFAIFDARTAVSLNCSLAGINDSRRFFVPNSQNPKITLLRECFKREPPYLDYQNYLSVLACFTNHGLASDILEAEMVLFSNAIVIAQRFLHVDAL